MQSDDESHASATKGGAAASIKMVQCPNVDCRAVSIFASYTSAQCATSEWQLVPEASIRKLPTYIPQAIVSDYREAFLVKASSPKVSATLSRRCLQGMIRDFWSLKAGSLYKEIDALSKLGQVDPQTLESIDAVRKIGSIGAHMEKDINTIVDVEQYEADILLELIDSLIDDWYVARHEREVRSAKLRAVVAHKESVHSHT